MLSLRRWCSSSLGYRTVYNGVVRDPWKRTSNKPPAAPAKPYWANDLPLYVLLA